MSRNIEIKARTEGLATLIPLVEAIADEGPIDIAQDDTFFQCPNGRLKLRCFGNGKGELIFYQRLDDQGPKESFYLITPTDQPDSLRDTLAHAFGQAGRVRKQRTLFLIGQTRVHLDLVEGLGEFMELEVVLDDTQTMEQGTAIAEGIMAQLGIRPDQLVRGAYVDLLCAC